MAGVNSWSGRSARYCAWHFHLVQGGPGARERNHREAFAEWRRGYIARLTPRAASVWRAPAADLWQWVTGASMPPLEPPANERAVAREVHQRESRREAYEPGAQE